MKEQKRRGNESSGSRMSGRKGMRRVPNRSDFTSVSTGSREGREDKVGTK